MTCSLRAAPVALVLLTIAACGGGRESSTTPASAAAVPAATTMAGTPMPETPPASAAPASTPASATPASMPASAAPAISMAMVPPGAFLPEPRSIPPADKGMAFMQAKGLAAYPAFQQLTIDTFFRAQNDYLRGDYDAARRRLDAMWAAYPRLDAHWAGASGLSHAMLQFTDAVNWRLKVRQGSVRPNAPIPLVMTVVVPARSRGITPRTRAELENRTGVETTSQVDPLLTEPNHDLLRDTFWLFGEWLKASSNGQLQLVLNLHISEVEMRYRFEPMSGGYNGTMIVPDLSTFVTPEVVDATDLWLYVHPTPHPPGADFVGRGWLGGGAGVGPNGGIAISTDMEWLLDTGGIVSKGQRDTIDRQLGITDWYAHEFLHEVSRLFPECKLELISHQWFDRSKWPANFVGNTEGDYLNEAMNKCALALPGGSSVLAQRMLAKSPPPDVWRQLPIDSLTGRWQLAPDPNIYNKATATLDPQRSPNGTRLLRWASEAGNVYLLDGDLDADGRLRSGRLTLQAPPPGLPKTMTVKLKFDAARPGGYAPQVIGIDFGGLFTRP